MRARLFWLILTVLAYCGPPAHAIHEVLEENGTHVVPDITRWEGYFCDHLPEDHTIRNGSVSYCRNCDPAADPAACGGAGTGCVIKREAGVWHCLGGGGANACTGCDPNPCVNGGSCIPSCAGEPFCVCPCGFTGDTCETTVTTTTTTPTSTTTTTIEEPG